MFSFWKRSLYLGHWRVSDSKIPNSFHNLITCSVNSNATSHSQKSKTSRYRLFFFFFTPKIFEDLWHCIQKFYLYVVGLFFLWIHQLFLFCILYYNDEHFCGRFHWKPQCPCVSSLAYLKAKKRSWILEYKLGYHQFRLNV